MDATQALDLINKLLRERGEKSLKDTEEVILKEVWENPRKGYLKIAHEKGYSDRSLTVIASELWQRLSQVFGVEIKKNKVRAVVEEYKRKQEQAVLEQGADSVAEIGIASLDSSSSGDKAVDFDNENDYTRSVDGPPIPPRLAKVDWGECPDTSIFFGREQELATLQQWLVADRCRVVALLGMGGIGKTSLAAKLTDQMQGAFDYVIWRSLREAPPLDEILVRLIQFVSAQQETELSLPMRLGERLNRLVDYLRERRCLLVLDNAEAIFQEGSVGQYRQGYEGYGELFKRLGEATHQSCLLLTSREKPRELAVLEGATLPVRCWPVGGIEAAAGLAILQAKGVRLAGDGAQGDDLIQRCGGNPQILRLVAAEIQDLFAGDVADFLRERVTAQEDVRGLLDEQFSRLAPLEQSVMYWLMINREPVTVDELLEELLPPVSRREVLQALRGLVDRSLIEAVDKQFTLQNVIMEYLTDRFVEKVSTELETQQFDYFHSHALIKATAKDYVRETQIRLILKPISSHISNLEQKIKKILEIVRQNSNWSNGYSPGNLLNLLCQFQAEARSFDFSNLTLRQAHLKGIQLHASDLANSDCIHPSLTRTFSLINEIAFSPDGELMATGDGNGNIQLWRVREQQSLGTLSGHTNEVRSVAFSPDSQCLASGSEDATIRLWDLQTRQCLHTLSGHTNWVRSVAFSPDGQHLASGSNDTTIRLWDLQTHQCRHVLSGHTNWVISVAFSPDGQHLASGSGDATIRLWDLQTCQCLHTLSGHTNRVWSVAFSPDGQCLASGSEDATIRLWDLQTRQCLHTFSGHINWVNAVAFSPDGQHLASGSGDATIRLWDLQTRQCLHTFSGHISWVASVAFSPDGQYLVSGGEDATIRFWDVQTRQCLHTFSGHTNWVISVAFSPDGQYLASSSDDATIRLWNIQTRECLHTFSGYTHRVWSVAFSPDGQCLASGSEDATIRLWNIQTRECFHTFSGHTNRVMSVAFSPDGQYLASGSEDATIQLWNIQTRECFHTFSGHSNARSVTFSPDGQCLASGSEDATIRLWNIQTRECFHTFSGHTNRVRSVAFSPDGQYLASGSDDATIRLWDVQTGKCLAILQIPRPYEGTNITGIKGLTAAEKASMIALGAVDHDSEPIN